MILVKGFAILLSVSAIAVLAAVDNFAITLNSALMHPQHLPQLIEGMSAAYLTPRELSVV
jgi:hypothetical protein